VHVTARNDAKSRPKPRSSCNAVNWLLQGLCTLHTSMAADNDRQAYLTRIDWLGTLAVSLILIALALFLTFRSR
jgi:hypothetical protein